MECESVSASRIDRNHVHSGLLSDFGCDWREWDRLVNRSRMALAYLAAQFGQSFFTCGYGGRAKLSVGALENAKGDIVLIDKSRMYPFLILRTIG